MFCLCALECEAAVAALSRYEGLHYEQHPLPFQGKFTSWAIAAVEKLHTLAFGQDFFFLEELYTWQGVQVHNKGVWSETNMEKSHTQ